MCAAHSITLTRRVFYFLRGNKRTDVTETKGNNKENIVKEKGGHKLRPDSLSAIPPPPCWVLDQTICERE